MKTNAFLNSAQEKLNNNGIATARLDCLILLEDATNQSRSWLLAHPEYELKSYKVEKLKDQIERRANHEPLAYIRGKSEFYGREFIINSHTLQPRPETETMLELLFKQVESKKLKVKSIVDVGTGSGCIAITAKLEMPELEVYATDIDENCIKTARQNANSLGADIKLLHGNLIEPMFKLQTSNFKPCIVVANLPYVPDNHTINQAAMHEPRHAIFGGSDGLDLYRELFDQLQSLPNQPAFILTEALPPQHKTLQNIAKTAGYNLQQTQDFIQLFKQD
ncbi:MAG: peptide chain release factor N(5)-glutamine methyltransferase [Candidatus Saccharibacteria bacterium]|nr:peptide chain release factor N(5)-glutamine methyltransferase [Candidatus Saccharibacteria bacterium]